MSRTAPPFKDLDDWLSWQASLNPKAISLGLDRVHRVAERLSMGHFPCPVITVAGTNGKGSCVALLEAMLVAGGHRVCAYTSPHLLRYNERIRVAGVDVDDGTLCAAFERIEAVRGDVPLTYFEFGTLAALLIFRLSSPEAILLEVGLGGRLDAVNCVDADLALISSIGIDHADWLGPDRDSIGYEKAGIFRQARPAVCGDPDPPRRLLQHAADIGSKLHCVGRDFVFSDLDTDGHWSWVGWDTRLPGLPQPALFGTTQLRNAATSIAALKLLAKQLPVSDRGIHDGLRGARLPGRFQQKSGPVTVVLDVAHNAEACAALAANLDLQDCRGRTFAVLGMLGDKPAGEIARIMDARVHAWYLGGLSISGRAQSAQELVRKLGQLRGRVSCHADVPAAYAAACKAAVHGDRIVVFGSFHTVEAVLRVTG